MPKGPCSVEEYRWCLVKVIKPGVAMAVLAVSPRFLRSEQTMLLLPLQLWPCPSPAQPIAALSGGQQPITGRVYAASESQAKVVKL